MFVFALFGILLILLSEYSYPYISNLLIKVQKRVMKLGGWGETTVNIWACFCHIVYDFFPPCIIVESVLFKPLFFLFYA